MDLFTVFLIIAVAILIIIGLLWLISWLTGSREDKENVLGKLTQVESVAIKEPEKETRAAEPGRITLSATPEPDDLKMIEGIGPKIEKLLNHSGITAFSQLAVTKVIILESILKEANIRIANPSTWAEQAALAAEGNWDELQKLKNELQGGRKVE